MLIRSHNHIPVWLTCQVEQVDPSAKQQQTLCAIMSNTLAGSPSLKFLLMVLLSLAYISFGVLFSMPEPIYPHEAQQRGATPYEVGHCLRESNKLSHSDPKKFIWQYGGVIGTAHFSAFATSLIVGVYGSRVTPKFLLNFSGIAQGMSGILLGLLQFVQNKILFLSCSYILRLVQWLLWAFVNFRQKTVPYEKSSTWF